MANATARSHEGECVNSTTVAANASAKLRVKAYMALTASTPRGTAQRNYGVPQTDQRAQGCDRTQIQ